MAKIVFSAYFLGVRLQAEDSFLFLVQLSIQIMVRTLTSGPRNVAPAFNVLNNLKYACCM